MPKRTYKPSKGKRLRKHGFRHRLKTAIKIIKRRRNKGRSQMAPKPMTTKKRYK